jgi:hypothetical protein
MKELVWEGAYNSRHTHSEKDNTMETEESQVGSCPELGGGEDGEWWSTGMCEAAKLHCVGP